MNRDQRRALKLNTSLPHRVAAEMGLQVISRKTSTSGRWVSLLCEHRISGLPCFDVVNINTDGYIDRHEFATVEAEEISYEDARDMAKAKAREFFDSLVAKLQAPAQSSLQEENNAGLKIISPDGSEEDYNYVN